MKSLYLKRIEVKSSSAMAKKSVIFKIMKAIRVSSSVQNKAISFGRVKVKYPQSVGAGKVWFLEYNEKMSHWTFSGGFKIIYK